MSTHPHLPAEDIASQFDRLHWRELTKPHLTSRDIATVTAQLATHPQIDSQILGQSYEGNSIFRYSLGNGPLTILAWTQMHGDEATATAAVLDWLHILATSTLHGLAANWREQVTLHIIPMLNPDGAARCTRENGQGIDINRDAIALQTPEGRILHQQVQLLSPDVAFNLHDQNAYYSAGLSANPATIAFLAPAYHQEKHVNQSRLRAKQLIAGMAAVLRHYIPDCIGRYDDTYSVRSFGDNIAAHGASTILIESGAAMDDPCRQTARKMNVIALQTALEMLLTQTYSQYSLADYYRIPENREDSLCDLKIEGLLIGDNEPYTADLAILIDRKTRQSEIAAIGDMRTVHGYQHVNGEGLHFVCGEGYTVSTKTILDDATYIALLAKGFSYFIDTCELLVITTSLPVRIEKAALEITPLLPKRRAFFLLRKDNKMVNAVLEGRWVTL